ncbi:MAG: domain S-box protein [Gammaproteobacteria bacterium]|nr:domain S-box protein [Gammaproteobacteria bacterium]
MKNTTVSGTPVAAEAQRIAELEAELQRRAVEAQAALRELQHFHYALDQHASVAVADLNGTMTHANQRFCGLSGYSREELIGKTHAVVRAGVHPPAVYEELWRTILSGSVWRGELCNQKKSGERYWVDASIVPFKDDFGRITQFVSICIEITERKFAQERLVRQEALLATTSRMAEIGGWELQRDASGPQWSDVIYRIHDLPMGPPPSMDTALGFFPPEVRTMLVDSVKAAFGEAKPFDFVAPLVTAAGRRRWVRSIGEPQIVNGEVTSIIGALQDITRQKHLEVELAHAQKLESIGQLSAGIAHEINTPAQFIGNNVAFLKEASAEIVGVLDRIAELAESRQGGTVTPGELLAALRTVDMAYLREEVPRAIAQSAEGIERIQTIVGAMKEFSHPAVDKMPTDVNRAIESTIIVASNEWKYVADVKTDFDRGLPLVSVMPGSFNQVVLNMIVNAAHAIGAAAEMDPKRAGKPGTIEIATRRAGTWAEVRIRDTGCGIPEKIRDRIFDPFFTTKPLGKGTGQGLAIAHDVIVNKHGGTISVQTDCGIGTTFIVRLPLNIEDPDATAAA